MYVGCEVWGLVVEERRCVVAVVANFGLATRLDEAETHCLDCTG
jgi:hypothetical protein